MNIHIQYQPRLTEDEQRSLVNGLKALACQLFSLLNIELSNVDVDLTFDERSPWLTISLPKFHIADEASQARLQSMLFWLITDNYPLFRIICNQIIESTAPTATGIAGERLLEVPEILPTETRLAKLIKTLILTDDEAAALDRFRCPISKEVMDVPIRLPGLNSEHFDRKTIYNIQLTSKGPVSPHPLTRASFLPGHNTHPNYPLAKEIHEHVLDLFKGKCLERVNDIAWLEQQIEELELISSNSMKCEKELYPQIEKACRLPRPASYLVSAHKQWLSAALIVLLREPIDHQRMVWLMWLCDTGADVNHLPVSALQRPLDIAVSQLMIAIRNKNYSYTRWIEVIISLVVQGADPLQPDWRGIAPNACLDYLPYLVSGKLEVIFEPFIHNKEQYKLEISTRMRSHIVLIAMSAPALFATFFSQKEPRSIELICGMIGIIIHLIESLLSYMLVAHSKTWHSYRFYQVVYAIGTVCLAAQIIDLLYAPQQEEPVGDNSNNFATLLGRHFGLLASVDNTPESSRLPGPDESYTNAM